MSVAVALDRLAEQVDKLGPGAFLISVGPDGKSHVVSVLVRLEGDDLAGRSRAYEPGQPRREPQGHDALGAPRR